MNEQQLKEIAEKFKNTLSLEELDELRPHTFLLF